MSEKSSLDGIPLRLTNKFYPQAKPRFQEIDIHIPIDALQDDYDFSFERSVIVGVNSWEVNKRIQDELKAVKLKKRVEEEDRLNAQRKLEEEEHKRLEEEEEKVRKVKDDEQRKVEEERLEAQRKLEEEEQGKVEEERKKTEVERESKFEHVVLAEDGRSDEQNSQTTNATEGSSSVGINLSDFESDFTNPFDNLELKSINEMEVLATVFPVGFSSNPEISSRSNTPVTAPAPNQVSNQSYNIQTSTNNSFNKYYFPLLTSMADSRVVRDQRNQFYGNFNPEYSQHPPPNVPTNTTLFRNQFSNASRNSPTQQFPILGSLSQPSSYHYMSDGAEMAATSYPMPLNPLPNAPVGLSDHLQKSTRNPPATNINVTNTPNGTQQNTH